MKLLDAKLESLQMSHMFDTCPQDKIVIAYNCRYDATQEKFCVLTVNSVVNGKVIKYLHSENNVTAVSCPDESLVIAGTDQGSILIYDLHDFNKSTLKELNYQNLMSEYDDDRLKEIKKRYQMRNATYTTDGLTDYFHSATIVKLTTLSQGNSHQIVALDEFGCLTSWTLMHI